MNGTEFLFSPGEEAVISLTGLLFCPIVCTTIYLIAVKRLRVKENETIASKAHLFYRMTSGIILGQVLNYTIWSVQLVPLFVCVGYYLLEVIDAFVSLDVGEERNGDIALNKETMEEETVFVFKDITDASYREGQASIRLNDKIKKRRHFMLWVTLFAFTLISISNGFHLASGLFPYNKTATLCCYVANAVAMTVAVCSCMIHARYHVREEHRYRILWWFSVSLLWCVPIVFCGGTIIILVGVQSSLAQEVIQSNAFTGIFGVSSGLLLRIHQYFHHSRAKGVADKQDTFIGLSVFALSLAQSVVIGVYF